jgi:hypothetical protein
MFDIPTIEARLALGTFTREEAMEAVRVLLDLYTEAEERAQAVRACKRCSELLTSTDVALFL